MPFHTCIYIKSNGIQCGSPAVQRRVYCHYHQESVIREARRNKYIRRAAAKISTSRPNSNKPKDLATLTQQPQ